MLVVGIVLLVVIAIAIVLLVNERTKEKKKIEGESKYIINLSTEENFESKL